MNKVSQWPRILIFLPKKPSVTMPPSLTSPTIHLHMISRSQLLLCQLLQGWWELGILTCSFKDILWLTKSSIKFYCNIYAYICSTKFSAYHMLHTVDGDEVVRERLDFQGIHTWRRPKQLLTTMRSVLDTVGKERGRTYLGGSGRPLKDIKKGHSMVTTARGLGRKRKVAGRIPLCQ